MFDVKAFRVKPGKSLSLKSWPTRMKPVYGSKADYTQMLDSHIARLSEQQQRLYASNSHALLIILQGMDTAGKDSAVKHVMSGVNPQGCSVHSFKQPSHDELQHDFLWRAVSKLPERGRIGIFNRSYYEEVLVARVHADVLKGEGIPDLPDKRSKVWQQRFTSINDFEQHLHANGTRIIKFFLHLSKDEQRKRLLHRIDDPQKNWKFSADDMKERDLWPKYTKAYEACLSHTSSSEAPWYVVPADDKENARLVISQIILHTIEKLHLDYPTLTADKQGELQDIKRQLLRESS